MRSRRATYVGERQPRSNHECFKAQLSRNHAPFALWGLAWVVEAGSVFGGVALWSFCMIGWEGLFAKPVRQSPPGKHIVSCIVIPGSQNLNMAGLAFDFFKKSIHMLVHMSLGTLGSVTSTSPGQDVLHREQCGPFPRDSARCRQGLSLELFWEEVCKTWCDLSTLASRRGEGV